MPATTASKPNESPIQLSEGAAAAVRSLLDERSPTARPFLLVSVRGGGCSGLSYVLDLVSSPLPGYQEVQSRGIAILLPPGTLEYMENLYIDFVDDGLNEGFTFSNPLARHTCGCGSSFSV